LGPERYRVKQEANRFVGSGRFATTP